jgi:hypothetical protein
MSAAVREDAGHAQSEDEAELRATACTFIRKISLDLEVSFPIKCGERRKMTYSSFVFFTHITLRATGIHDMHMYGPGTISCLCCRKEAIFRRAWRIRAVG